uniref:Uncharacterized protein n=1 Tax=Parascaris univalens TaxID=6257 RepID=A0A915CI07_PARUN
EDQDHRSSRKEVLCLDWRIHPRLPFHLPTDVDLETRIRRIRTIDRTSKMLLSKTCTIATVFVGPNLGFKSCTPYCVSIAQVYIKTCMHLMTPYNGTCWCPDSCK